MRSRRSSESTKLLTLVVSMRKCFFSNQFPSGRNVPVSFKTHCPPLLTTTDSSDRSLHRNSPNSMTLIIAVVRFIPPISRSRLCVDLTRRRSTEKSRPEQARDSNPSPARQPQIDPLVERWKCWIVASFIWHSSKQALWHHFSWLRKMRQREERWWCLFGLTLAIQYGILFENNFAFDR